MRSYKLAFLTIFALPVPVVAALVSIHCQGAALTDLSITATNEPLVEGSTNPPTLARQTITSFILSPGTLGGGKTSTGTVYLRYPAGAGGVSVSLQNSNPSAATHPQRIVIPEGKTSVRFAIATRPVTSLVSLNISATCQNATTANALTLLPPEKHRWHVSPTGSSRGLGTPASPWDLATALAHGPGGSEVKPGDTIVLRAGRYTGTFLSTLKGTANAPIIVRAAPRERVIIDKAVANEAKQPALKIKGPWVWFWGIEVMNSSPDRRRNSPYSGNDEPWRGSGVDVYAPNVKLINMIFHDNGHGIWDKKDMTEVHGSLFFYNGNNKREHAMYIGNATGTKYITDNIVFDQGGYGILSHSDSGSSSQKGLHIEGNVTFNNGMLTADDQRTGNLQVSGVAGVPAERIVISSNYVYNSPENAKHKNNGVRLGYEDTGNKDVKFVDNYVVSKAALMVWWWQNVHFEGNTIYSNGDAVELKLAPGVSSSAYRWDFNSYLSGRGAGPKFANAAGTFSFAQWRQTTGLDLHSQLSATRPSGGHVFVRPNRYEAGRGNIVIYNWDLRDRVAVDVSSVLTPGAHFEIRDAQNYFAEPVLRGIYTGAPLLVPTNLTKVTPPIGNVERVPRHTAPEFVVLVLQTTAGA